MKTRYRLLLLSCVLLFGIGIIAPLTAQGEIILTLSIDSWLREMFTPDLFADFYADHPGVKVVVVSPAEDSYTSPAAYGVDDHLEGIERLASTGDVVAINSYYLSLESTRAGAFLDLSPLVAGDSSLDTDDFFPAVWQSFQWENGVWAIPMSASLNLVIYDAAAFDAANLPYPDETWQIENYIDAARELAQINSNGDVVNPGMMAWDVGRFYIALTGDRGYDDSTGSVIPHLNSPELVDFLETIAAAQKEGIINNPGQDNFNFNLVPITLDSLWRLYGQSFQPGEEEADWRGTLLPGGKALLSNVQGLAISAGTDYPELAYELIVYLSSNPEAVNFFYGDVPARQSLLGLAPDENAMIITRVEIPDDVRPLLESAITNAIPISDMLFGDYIMMVYNQLLNDENAVDPQTVLQDTEVQIVQNLETASTARDTLVVMIPTPVPTPVLSADEITIKFAVRGSMSPTSVDSQWQQLAREFAESDPQVGYVELSTGFGPQQEEEPDCFFEDYDGRITAMDINNPDLLSLDPLIDADPLFDRNDMLPRVMDQVTRDNRVWGYPLALYPEILLYNNDLFEQANAFNPENGWTVNEFNDTLHVLSTLPDTMPVFVPMTYNGTYMLMLMAAYGALPYDSRVEPPVINISDPAAVDAMRQVLDLAKDGYIAYQELGGFGGGGGGGLGSPIYTDTLSSNSWILQNRSNTDMPEFAAYRLANYPTGIDYTPLSYSLGMAYINSSTPAAEACYRWIGAIAQHPELTSGMPARQSQMNDPAVAAALGEDALAFYRMYEELLQSPNVIVFSTSLNTLTSWIEQHWLLQVFDHYVLKDADLETELADFEANALAVRQCEIPDLVGLGEDASDEEIMALYRKFGDCVIAIDPETSQYFGFGED